MTEVIASFGRAAPTYLAHAGVQEAMADWLADWLPAVRTGRALEVGAGPGTFTRRLLPWQGTLLATDASRAMTAAGRKAWPAARWRTMAAERPLAGPWDWIFCSSMLQWAEQPAAVFRAWRRRLAPGGRILAGLFVAGTLEEWNALAGPGPLRWRSADDWRVLIEDAGLRIRREGTEQHIHYHASAAAFLRSLHDTGAAPFRRLPPARLRRVLRAYDERHRSAAGVPAQWRLYRFEAEAG
jgi:SAM-dependent methyltransferase